MSLGVKHLKPEKKGNSIERCRTVSAQLEVSCFFYAKSMEALIQVRSKSSMRIGKGNHPRLTGESGIKFQESYRDLPRCLVYLMSGWGFEMFRVKDWPQTFVVRCITPLAGALDVEDFGSVF